MAALRLADLGKEVLLVEARERPGGTCLLEGCIPSKALIHAVEIRDDGAPRRAEFGLHLRRRAASTCDSCARGPTAIVERPVSDGVGGLLKRRGVEVRARPRAVHLAHLALAVEGGEVSGVDFQQAIIATGSSLNRLPAGHRAVGVVAAPRR